MVMTLHGRATSVNVQKPLWLMKELGLEFERIDVGGRHGGTDTPEYGALNPNRLVPTLVDGGLTVWESHAILRYIAAQYGGVRMWEPDPARRAIVDQWIDWTASTFQPAWLAVFAQAFRAPPQQRDADAIAAAIGKAEACFAIMDGVLQERPYLAGSGFTIADIAAGVAMHRWTTMEIDRKTFPAVDAWHARLKERAPFVEVVCTDYSELAVRA